MHWLTRFFHNLQTRFIWKLMASYVIVIITGITTLAIAVESVAPAAFSRHMMGMGRMMMSMGMGTGMTVGQIESDMFAGFRYAVNEALLVAAITATVSAILVSGFISRRVVIPIRQLTRASGQIAAGHYQTRVQVVGNDELGQLAQSFNQMATALAHNEAVRRELIANVAHELRTPLTSIKGYMEGLVDGILPADAATFQQIYHEADRLQHLVDNLQELSRVEAGAFELHIQPVSIAHLIETVAARLEPQFTVKGVQLLLDLPSDLPLVPADADRICQVLLNIIGNALQYTPAGGTVLVTAARHGRELLVTTRDTGIGIPAEHLPHLFTRFYRVDKSRSRAAGGSGIGLTIVKHLVEAHGGRVWAESDGPGKGSCFGFSLPLDRH